MGPKHVAISLRDSSNLLETVMESIETCINLGIPMVTIQMNDDAIVDVFSAISNWEFAFQKGIKVSIIGKWYSLPSNVIDSVKKVIENTKDYDNFFVNFCINYDGQEEILDACKLIAKQVQMKNLDPDNISKALLKDNLYSSYFMPPDLIIKLTDEKKGFLLWDSVTAKIYYAAPDEEKWLSHALEWYKKY